MPSDFIHKWNGKVTEQDEIVSPLTKLEQGSRKCEFVGSHVSSIQDDATPILYLISIGHLPTNSSHAVLIHDAYPTFAETGAGLGRVKTSVESLLLLWSKR